MQEKLDSIEGSVSSLHDKLDKVLRDHESRLTKVETKVGFLQAALAFIITTATGVFVSFIKRT